MEARANQISTFQLIKAAFGYSKASACTFGLCQILFCAQGGASDPTEGDQNVLLAHFILK